MPPFSGKQRKAQLKLKRAIKRGDAPLPSEQPRKRKKRARLNPRQTPEARLAADQAAKNARNLQSQFIKLDKSFLDDTRALAGSVVLRRPIPSDVAVFRHEWITPTPPRSQLAQLAVPKRPKWRYQMSKDELDANEQACFRTWLTQQDVTVEQWQRALNAPPSTDQTISSADPAGDRVVDSETHLMPHPPTHFERNIEVWRQFWRVTEISQILLVLLDSRCAPLHLPSSLAAHLSIPSSSSPQSDPNSCSKQSSKSTALRIIIVLTKVDISGLTRTASWTSFLNANYPGVPVVPVEAYSPKSSLTVQQGPYSLLQPPHWVTTLRAGESEEERLQRIDQWRPKVKRVIDWDGVLRAKGNLVGKTVGGAAVPKGRDVKYETEGAEVEGGDDVKASDSEEVQMGDAHEWKEPEFLTVGVIGQPNVGKSSLLNAIFGSDTRHLRWTANDIMTAYAEKKGWVTAKAGRPDIHRAGNAILRLVAEGKIPWGFWPPGSSVSGGDGIWLKDGVQQHTWDKLEVDEEDGTEEQDSEMEELPSEEEDIGTGIRVASGESDGEDEDEERLAREAMLNSWFGSASSRRSQPRQTRSNPPPALNDPQSGLSDASSVSRSTVGTPGNLTSTSDVPLDGVHAHINDPSVYAPTPSLIHSAEKEAGTLRTSDAPTSLDATTYQRDSAQITKRVSPPECLEETLFTPQDTIVAQVFGKSVPPATDPARATPPPQPSGSLMTSDSLPPPFSMQTAPSSSARPGPTLTIYDPFSGAKLGEHTPISPSTATPGDSTPLPTADDRKLWSSLERILELQAEIAAMHVNMEGVGGRGLGNTHTGGIPSVGVGEGGNAGPVKRSRRGQTLPVGDEEPEEHERESGATGRAVSEISTDHSGGEDEDEDDEDEDDIHGYGKRRRDEEFARLAEQFAQRRVAIGGIMNKLDDLSTALKTFHALPPPLFDIAMSPSRTDTVSSAPSNVSATSSPPPFNMSPLSSISPSQVASSVTPPTISLSPPVPPMSTLAPLVSFGDPGTPPGLAPIVTPVLPRTVLPTIIPGISHMESPDDMDPAQSIFRGVP
ncbi:hypothetical protein J3R83DRAFT_6271 [Lanmaoa asiatica]|nr:hypothetical protein J3R83DRAFT_6271 [Lanmaoa asiatica]